MFIQDIILDSRVTMRCNINWPVDISDELKERLLSIGKYRLGAESIPLTRMPQAPSGIYYISKGVISLGIINEASDSEVAVLFSKGDWLFSEYLFQPEKLFLVANEIEEVEFVYFSFSELKRISSDTEEIYKLFLSTASNIHLLMSQRLFNVFLPKKTRVAYALVDLYFRVKSNNNENEFNGTINISQNKLAVITNLSRPKLNTELKRLELKGEISIGRGRIKVIDIEKINYELEAETLVFRRPG